MIRKLRDDWTATRGGRAGWKAFHDQFLSYGGPPIPLVRAQMLGDDTPALVAQRLGYAAPAPPHHILESGRVEVLVKARDLAAAETPDVAHLHVHAAGRVGLYRPV